MRWQASPTQHRFWNIPTQKQLKTHHTLVSTLQDIGITQVYNPPGDGLCYWYALCHGTQPQLDTHYSKMKRAIELQRQVIRYARERASDATTLAHYMHILSADDQVPQPVTSAYILQQLSLLEHNPQLYHLPINDVLHDLAPTVLQCRIDCWTVYKPGQLHAETNGQGRTISLLYDPLGKHYLTIEATKDTSPCTETPTHLAASSPIKTAIPKPQNPCRTNKNA